VLSSLVSPRPLPALAAALAIATLAPAASRAEERWKLDTGGEIVFQRVTPLGTLLVSTEMNLRAVDPATGKTLWMRDDVRMLKEGFYDEIADTPYGLLDLGDGSATSPRRIEVIDLENGRMRWDSRNLPMSSTQGIYQIPQKNLLLMVGLPRQTQKSGVLIEGKKSMLLSVDLTSGAMKWRQDSLFSTPVRVFEVHGTGKVVKRRTIEGNQPPVYDGESGAFLYLSEDGPVKFDLATGDPLWTGTALAGRKPPALRDGYAAMQFGEGALFVPFGRSLQAFDATSGAPLWKAPPEFRSQVAQMKLVAQGLVVRGQPNLNEKGNRIGKPFIDILDPVTGRSVWTRPFKDHEITTSFDVRADCIYVATAGELFAISIADGSSRVVARFKLKGGEVPTTVEALEGGCLISSNQNMVMVDADGAQKYHSFYMAPTATGWARLATTAAIMAANAAAAAEAHARVMAASDTQQAALAAANPKLVKRYQASANVLAYRSVLANTEAHGLKGPGLVKVEKSTGKEMARVVLGVKAPAYELDPIGGKLYFLKSPREIVCYDF
jgi:outer membrane protein assembly factor BamB